MEFPPRMVLRRFLRILSYFNTFLSNVNIFVVVVEIKLNKVYLKSLLSSQTMLSSTTLVREVYVFLDFLRVRKPRSGERESRSGEKEKLG